MRFTVRHLTRYAYSAPVTLGAHLLRLTPRAGVGLDHDFAITPAPVRRIDERDAHGNAVTRLDFAGETRVLEIESRFTLETTGAGVPADAGRAAYLALGLPDPEVAAFAALIGDESGGAPAAFAEHLNATLFSTIRHDIRDTGAARPAGTTLALGEGACRDIAVLFVETCRLAGLPARFVSGYQAESSRPTDRRYMHAWPEVWLEDRGWQGYDPTRGVAVAEAHVALAAAPDQAGTMPVEGAFYGTGVSSDLAFELDIRAEL